MMTRDDAKLNTIPLTLRRRLRLSHRDQEMAVLHATRALAPKTTNSVGTNLWGLNPRAMTPAKKTVFTVLYTAGDEIREIFASRGAGHITM